MGFFFFLSWVDLAVVCALILPSLEKSSSDWKPKLIQAGQQVASEGDPTYRYSLKMNVVDKEGVIHERCPAAGYPRERGATAWDDGPGGQVKHINLYHGEIIHSVQTTYERNGTLVMSRKHGGAEDNFTMINFSEPLTRVSGHYGPFCFDNELAILNPEADERDYLIHVINSLKFSTARNTYGPFGTERGTPFSFQTVTEITGFHGVRTGSADVGHPYAIGVYVRCPATQYIDDPATQVVVKYEKT